MPPDPNPNPNPNPNPSPDPKPDPRDEAIKNLQAQVEALTKKFNPPADDPDLQKKARAEQDEKDKRERETKSLESAIKFNLGAKDWVKTNSALLPKGVEGIFTAAEKEKYDNALQKDAAIKSGIIQEFFGVQENLDLLTSGPKSALEEYLKMSKTGRQDKAQQIFESVFEPAFEMLKQVKKAQQLNNGVKNQTDGEKALADRMHKMSKQHYLGEKNA